MPSQVSARSPLLEMIQTTPTCLWNDSASIEELAYSIEHGAVGAICNPVIAYTVLKRELPVWRPRILEIMEELRHATEELIAWQVIEEMSVKAGGAARDHFPGST